MQHNIEKIAENAKCAQCGGRMTDRPQIKNGKIYCCIKCWDHTYWYLKPKKELEQEKDGDE